MHTVTILQYRLFHYRVDLFERLRTKCREADIELHVVAGQAFGREKDKQDEGNLSWVEPVSSLYFPIKEKKDLCWQPIPRHLANSSLVVVMQENRLLANYWLMIRRRIGGPRLAFWGHGRDFQTNVPGGLREWWKLAVIGQVDWWFAYTRLTVEVITEAGYPADRITCLNNAIDVDRFREEVESIDSSELSGLREHLGWQDSGGPVAVFCGSLYPDKKLDLLIEAADIVRSRVPGFQLVVIGDGSSAPIIREAAASRDWVAHVGVQRGRDKAKYFRFADVVLNPGLVGLHVLDAFAAGLPMVTTQGAKHSPEISYLEHGRNGLITGDTVTDYASAVSAILQDRERLAALKQSAAADASRYTVDNMASNFVQGMVGCLAAPKLGRFSW